MLTTRYLITFLSLAYRQEQLLFPRPIAQKALDQAANLEHKSRGTGKVSRNSLTGREVSTYESNCVN